MFNAALFTIAKTWKQQEFIKGWMDFLKMWHIYNRVLFNHKKKEILQFVTTWMDLEGIVLSEVRQRQKPILYDLIYMWNLKKKKNQKQKNETKAIDTENRLMVARGRGGNGWRWSKATDFQL